MVRTIDYLCGLPLSTVGGQGMKNHQGKIPKGSGTRLSDLMTRDKQGRLVWIADTVKVKTPDPSVKWGEGGQVKPRQDE